MFKFFQNNPPAGPATEVGHAGHSDAEVIEEYSALILQQLAHGGVSALCVELDVHQTGKLRDGRQIYVGMLRLVKWERASAVRLLLGLPILESRLRRAIKVSWLRDVSHFSGIWLHASGQLQDTAAMQDLRELVVEIEKMDSEPSPVSGAVWSLPTDVGTLR